jgi:hypothetical protein
MDTHVANVHTMVAKVCCLSCSRDVDVCPCPVQLKPPLCSMDYRERKREGGNVDPTGLQDSTVIRGVAELERVGPVPSQAFGD